MPGRPSLERLRGHRLALFAAVAVVMLCWIIGNPRSSGPDESSHMVTAAGLVRGQLNGDANPLDPGSRLFEVPAMVGAPDPGCWALSFDPGVPVGCQNSVPLETAERELASTSYNYPPWALVLPGVASFAPTARGYAYLARLLNAAIPCMLVSLSLWSLARTRSVAACAALVGLTPIAWFTFGVVNPSAIAIAGGLALWTGLLSDRSRRVDHLADHLTLAGWAAVLLARRDGPVWATLIVLTACWLVSRTPREVWASLPRSHRVAVVALVPLPLVTPIVNGFYDFNLVLALSPLALIAAQVLTDRWRRTPTPGGRRALAAYTALALVVAIGVALTSRPGGFDSLTARLVISNTGEHLRQLVGVLGWLSTPVPSIAVFLFWGVVGGLAALAAVEFRRAASTFVIALGIAVVVAWLLELGQGADYGRYWHGRYTMPFAVGFPLVLAWRPSRREWLTERISPMLSVSSWLIANIAFVAAQQRWAVGINGSWRPWNWDTWGAPVSPLVLVVVHAVATAGLALVCTTPSDIAPTREVRS